MAWKLEDVRIFLQEIGNTPERIAALLQPIEGYTVIQLLGKKVPTYNLNYYLVGSGDKLTVENYVEDGTLCTLSGPEGVLGNFYIHNAKFERQMAVKQTIRTDLPTNAEVYIVNSELFKSV